MKAELVIARTWSGDPVAVAAQVVVAIENDAVHVAVTAHFRGDPPPPGPPCALPGLWNFEVVELFIVGAPYHRSAPYLELEVGPFGHWLAWSFSGYREKSAEHTVTPPDVRRDVSTWEAQWRLPIAALPPGPWRVNAFAIHGPPDARVYLAATSLGGERPDFHRVDEFVTSFVNQPTHGV